jgi:hypothetical protein
MRLVWARRDADLVDRAPKTIAGTRIVMAEVSGALSGSGADEDKAQVILKLVGEFFQSVHALFFEACGEGFQAKLSSNASWGNISEEGLMRGSQSKWNHILARTFLRPRDVIRFLNAALDRAKERGGELPLIFANEDIVGSREDYSSYLKQELDDEIRSHWAHWDDALQACSAISTITFEREDFEREYAQRKSPKNDVTAAEALALLYRFSVIGYARGSGYGGSSWAFQYTDPDAGWDNVANRFKVHLGLKEYAKLRETRE